LTHTSIGIVHEHAIDGYKFINVVVGRPRLILLIQIGRTLFVKVPLSRSMLIGFDRDGCLGVVFLRRRVKSKVSIIPHCDIQVGSPPVQNGIGQCLTGGIDGNHNVSQREDEVVVRQPFREAVVVVHDQQTGRKG
jgi:hypothetical protein